MMKKFLTILACAIGMLFLTTAAYAAPYENSSVALIPSATELKPGDAFTIIAQLTNTEATNLITIFLDYEDEVFEMIGGDCLVQNRVIGMVVPGEKSGTCMLGSSAVVSGNIYRFQMKVKETAPYGTYNILNKRSVLGVGAATNIVGTNTTLTVVCNHTYDQQIAEGTYKATDASCTAKATYYYSCTCGAKGTKTFACGNFANHIYDQQIAEGTYKATDASCTAKATYYYSCTCGAKGEKTFEYGQKLAHIYDQKKTSEAYLVSDATCFNAAAYFYSCMCGAAGESTFQHGQLADHNYGNWEKLDANQHKHSCLTDGCDATEVANHSFSETLIADANNHWQLCACGEKKNEAPHSYSGTWECDEQNHWQICACGTKSKIAKHTWDTGKVTVDTTSDPDGVKTYVCTDCGTVRTEVIDKNKSQGIAERSALLPVILFVVCSLLGIAVFVIRKRRTTK